MDLETGMAFMNLSPNFLKSKMENQQEELEERYLLLCKKYHPDNKKTGNSEYFDQLQKVYDVLKVYIGMGDNAENKDSCSDFFIRCTLTELYTGCHKTVRFNNYIGHIQIPPGTMDGQSMIITMYNAMGHPVGNYPVVILQINDTMLTRKGSDLHLVMNISLKQALIGEPVKVSLLGKRIVSVPVQIATSDQRHIIENCGMPLLGETGTFGKLIVSYRVTLPVSLEELEDITNLSH